MYRANNEGDFHTGGTQISQCIEGFSKLFNPGVVGSDSIEVPSQKGTDFTTLRAYCIMRQPYDELDTRS